MADDSLINTLLFELESTRKQLQEAQQEIQRLQIPPMPLLEQSQSMLTPEHPHTQSYIVKQQNFCVRRSKLTSTIEFPRISGSFQEIPSLLKQMSQNSMMNQSLRRIQQLKNEKQEIQASVQKKADRILADAQKEIDRMKEAARPALDERSDMIRNLATEAAKELNGGLFMDKNTERAYVVNIVDAENMAIQVSQILDNHGVPLLVPKQTVKELHEFSNFHLLPHSEFESLESTLEEKKIVVQYQLVEVEQNKFICCPINIEPKGLPIQDYELKFTNQQNDITKVVNKQDGPVKFQAVLLSNQIGLIPSSTVQIFTIQISPSIVNIFHIHVDDSQPEVPFDVVYILDSQSIEDYSDWSRDYRGVQLRYKILVKNGDVEAVLYNTGASTQNLHFIQRKVSIGDYVRIDDGIAQVSLVPTGMLARDWQAQEQEIPTLVNLKLPVNYCSKRHIEELPGLVDIKTVMRNGEIEIDPYQVALPICQCFQTSQMQRAQLSMLLESVQIAQKHNFELQLEQLRKMFEEAQNSEETNADFIEKISTLSQNVKKGVEGKQELIREHSQFLAQVDRILRILATRLRFS